MERLDKAVVEIFGKEVGVLTIILSAASILVGLIWIISLIIWLKKYKKIKEKKNKPKHAKNNEHKNNQNSEVKQISNEKNQNDVIESHVDNSKCHHCQDKDHQNTQK